MAKSRIAPIHPGSYLKEILDALGLSQYRLAQELDVPAMRISHVVRGQRPMTAELALRLGRYFDQSPRYDPLRHRCCGGSGGQSSDSGSSSV